MNKLELQKEANEIRKGIVTAVHSAKAGHPGGSLSAVEAFTYLYYVEMNIDPKDPKKPDTRPFCSLQRTYCSGPVFYTGTQRIFPGRRSENSAPLRFLPAGPSGYETHSRC